MPLNEKQVAIRGGGNYADLAAFLDRRKVTPLPFANSQSKAVSSAQFVLLDSGVISGTIALGTASVDDGGVSAAELAGAVGTAALTAIQDSNGNLLNLVEIRDGTTNNPLLDSSGRKIYALMQASNGVADGVAIGAPASENLQLSFVVFDSGGALALTTVDDTIEFQVNKLFLERSMPTIFRDGGAPSEVDVVTNATEPNVRKFVVTTAFAADEVLTLSTGDGASAGVSTDTGDTVVLGADAAAFNGDNLTRVRLNGVQLEKSVEAVWDSTDSLHVNIAMLIGDVLEVEVPKLES